jgi:hypothetical protein
MYVLQSSNVKVIRMALKVSMPACLVLMGRKIFESMLRL